MQLHPRNDKALSHTGGVRAQAGVWIAIGAICLLTGCASTTRPLQFLSGADLRYPAAAKAEGIEGYVVIRYDVTIEGTVANPQIIESQPEGVFEQAALASIVRWRFRAPLVRGEVTQALNRISTLRFRLGDSDDYDTGEAGE